MLQRVARRHVRAVMVFDLVAARSRNHNRRRETHQTPSLLAPSPTRPRQGDG